MAGPESDRAWSEHRGTPGLRELKDLPWIYLEKWEFLNRKQWIFQRENLEMLGFYRFRTAFQLLKPVVEVGIPLLRGELPWSCCTIPGIPGIPGGFARPFLK